MVSKGSTARRVTGVLAAFLIGAMSVGTAVAITSKAFRYSKPKTGWLSIHPADMAPDNIADPAKDYFNSWGGRLRNEDQSRCFNTGINLPQKAKIQSVTFYYESDATSEFFGYLFRLPLGDKGEDDLAVAEPKTDTPGIQSITIDVPTDKQTVKNKKYAYAMGVFPYLGSTFNGARITYTYRSASD